MDIRIVADSSCDLPLSFIANRGVDFVSVPLKIQANGREFVDTPDLDPAEMLAAVRASSTRCSTACPAPEEFAAAFRGAAGPVFAFTISSRLSGSYNSACRGRDMVLEENPAARILVIDSRTAACAVGLQIFQLAEHLRRGGSPEDPDLPARLEHFRDTLHTRFILHSFDNLVNAGRMSRIAGLMASALSIRPICGDNGNGEIKVFEKVRGTRTALLRLVQRMEEDGLADGSPVFLSQCNNAEDADFLRQEILRRRPACPVTVFATRGLASFYAGEGGIVAAY